jgi:hypothetical protein
LSAVGDLLDEQRQTPQGSNAEFRASSDHPSHWSASRHAPTSPLRREATDLAGEAMWLD